MPTQLWRRSFGLLLSLALLLGVFSSTEHASADGTRHPYFNDQGTLRWQHSLANAKRAATREGKLIFVEYGRRKCSNCRKLAERSLPHPTIRGRMSAVAIGLAADCDRPERAIWSMFKRNLPRARTLPFVAFLTPDGQWITGWAGYKSVNQVSAILRTAEARHTRLMAARRSKSRARSSTSKTATGRKPSRVRSAPVRKPESARKPEAVRKPAPAPCPTASAEDETHATDAGGCVGDECEVDLSGKPTFKTPTPLGFLPPCPTGSQDREKRERVAEPKRHLVARQAPAGRAPSSAGTAFPPAATQPKLPQPSVVAKRIAGLPPIATGDPDGPAVDGPGVDAPGGNLPGGTTPDGATPMEPTKPTMGATPVTIATKAAAQGDWTTVLRHTRHASKDAEPTLYALNRAAHGWAHARLAAAVRSIRERRYAEADKAVVEVERQMRGEAEAIDAERGADAIEFMRDIEPLAESSLVRRTVRKTAYEKMRGTRWASLFSPVPQAGAAVAKR